MLKSLALKNQNGFLAFQELAWKPVYPKLSLFFRYTIFETDSWDTRMYTYENNMLNSFSFPAFSGKGIHFFMYSNYSLGKNLKLRLQYGHTSYFDRAGISSGPYFIDSNYINELSCQLLLLF
jgi:hypothetical protein